jgi:hypothetical protein
VIGSATGTLATTDNAETISGETDPGAASAQRRPRRESFGILKGKIWIAPDFDDIPEGFEPYLGDNDVKDN